MIHHLAVTNVWATRLAYGLVSINRFGVNGGLSEGLMCSGDVDL